MKKWIFEMVGAVVAILLFLYVITVFQSCKSPQPIVQTEVKEVVVEREVRDTIVTILPDSAGIKALLECDSAGNVLIKELQEEQGKNVALQAQLKNTNKGTAIVIDCKQDSLERVIALQNEKIQELNNNKQTETIEVKYIPSFVKWFAWIGAFFVVFYLVKFGLWVYRKFILKV